MDSWACELFRSMWNQTNYETDWNISKLQFFSFLFISKSKFIEEMSQTVLANRDRLWCLWHWLSCISVSILQIVKWTFTCLHPFKLIFFFLVELKFFKLTMIFVIKARKIFSCLTWCRKGALYLGSFYVQEKHNL